MTGYSISIDARIAPVVLWNVRSLRLAAGSRIGPGNVLRDVLSVTLGDSAVMGQWNWISAASPLTDTGAPGALAIGDHSAITSRHYVDVSGGVRIGSYSTLAGVRSTLITHGINWKQGRQIASGISIGDYCLIGSNASIAPGVSVADGVVTSMGSALGGALEERSLYIGPRAERVGEVRGDYFVRNHGFVSPKPSEPGA